MAHTCNPNIENAKAGRLQEFEATLACPVSSRLVWTQIWDYILKQTQTHSSQKLTSKRDVPNGALFLWEDSYIN